MAIALLGLGHQGLRSLCRVIDVRRALKSEGIDLDLVALADKNVDATKRAVDQCQAEGLAPAHFASLENLLAAPQVKAYPRDTLVVYDATATQQHFGNLVQIQFAQHGYFGEKPILLTRNQLAIASGANFWCNFVETESAAFRGAQALIERDHLSIKSMRFWRESAVGTAKLLTQQREGVTGGSLEDKMIHDVALSLGFLRGTGQLSGANGHGVEGRLVLPMLNTAEVVQEIPPMFMSVDGAKTGVRWIDEAADARFDLTVTWPCNESPVVAHYSTSWVGVSSELRGWMQLKGISEGDWLGARTVPPRSGFTGYKDSEARIGYLECTAPDGRDLEIVVNFLADDGKLFKAHLKPWVRARSQAAPFHAAPLPELKYHDALTGAFATVIKACMGAASAPLLDSGAARPVHDILLRGRASAMEKHYGVPDLVRDFRETLKKQLIPFDLQ